MATDLGRVKSTATSKYDALVASQLKQAETRIRTLDLTAGLLGFAALCLAYIVGVILCDSTFLLSQHARQLSLYLFVLGAAVYLFLAVVRPLWLRVNPYYAARQVEQQLPHAKNSIVNWVDLHQHPLPPAIRGALGQRAAKDLSRVNLDRAISGRRAAWVGGIAGSFAAVFVVSFFLLGPKPFLSLLKRTFNPFEAVGISTRTRLTLLKPEGGNATVTVGHGINLVVEVGGKVPDPKAADAVKLLYRYDENDPWLERRLIQESSGEWTASLSAIEVRNGFWYQITGGDASTEEYRVGVRAAPAITDLLARYRFRLYVARADEVHRERELKALRGTEVLLRVRTNRMLREGRLEFEGNKRAGDINLRVNSVRGEVDAETPNTLLVRFVLDEDGKYRLCFTTTDGEAYGDPVTYPVTAIPDRPPTVELTKPGKDIRLPVDALLHLEGKAGDDIGVKSLVLRMRVMGGDRLRGQPYRSEEQLRLAGGGYPRDLGYKDFVDLSRVKNENDQAVPLHAGMELEYWLEASDACDYPRPNVSESKHYRVLLTDPEKNDPKKNQEKKQAEKEKKQHEQQQDQKLQKENQERQQQRQDQKARNKEEENKTKDAGNGGAGEKSQQKEGGQADNSGSKDNNGKEGGSNDGQGKSNNGDQKSGLSKEDQTVEEQIKKALERKEAGKNAKGEGSPDKGDRNESKGKQPNKSNGSEKSNAGNSATGRQGPKQPDKDKGKSEPQTGSASTQESGKSEPNNDNPKNQAGKTTEGKGKSEPTPQPGKNKPGEDSQSRKNAGQDKDKHMGQEQDRAKDSTKSGKGKGKTPRSQETGDSKDDRKTEKKQDNSLPRNEPSVQGKTKPEDSAKERDAAAKQIADLARALKSNDAREREKAKQQLQRIAKEAADSKARQKAGEALEKMGASDRPAGEETPKKDTDSSSKSEGGGKEGEKNSGSKEAGSSDNKGDDKGAGATSDPNKEQGDKKGHGSSSREAQPGSQASQNGNTPGGGGDRRSAEGDRGKPRDTAQRKQPDKPRGHRAAQMQLEDFAKRVNKDILKEAGVSEEAWKKYLENRRKQLTEREKPRSEAPIASQQATQLPSMGGQTIKPSATGQGDAQSPNRGQPPPGYRDSFREFTRQMSKKN